MEHVKPLAIKAVAALSVLFVVLGLGYGVSFVNVLLITLVLGAVSYLAGDLVILPKTNNIIATLSDAVVTFLVVWLMGMALAGGAFLVPAIVTTVLIGVFEFYFHIYIANSKIGLNSPSGKSWETTTDNG
ncbi:DUF2512 family protein [Alteribacter natronophilus]|uniref:DUF2512 family protein n=1 Tax=Alteribacter natronophilus TaxID=2583810 RepID=UPI00110F539A|nr:DUF2512 family protein [Alteribacter natronophilus]TMW71211.1 DUF2512 family protein [Alteribacter natronophilus]